MNFPQDRLIFKRLITPVMVWFCLHCTAPAFSQCGYGQSPDLAIPICNNDTIYQGAISPCTPRFVAGYDAQICINYNPQDYYTKKPMWYRIHCYNTGTLRFFLKYNNPGDLYVWQLFDITGSTANAVSTDPALTIRGNWGDNGIDYKGTAPGNFLLLGCAIGAPVILPPFNQMPILDAGHDYLLLVNHSDLTTDYGYKLVINGGTAVISDNTQPTLSKATGSCLLPQLVVKFSKSISCSSIAVRAGSPIRDAMRATELTCMGIFLGSQHSPPAGRGASLANEGWTGRRFDPRGSASAQHAADIRRIEAFEHRVVPVGQRACAGNACPGFVVADRLEFP